MECVAQDADAGQMENPLGLLPAGVPQVPPPPPLPAIVQSLEVRMPPPPAAPGQPQSLEASPATPTTAAAGSALGASLPAEGQQLQVEAVAPPLSAMQRLLHDWEQVQLTHCRAPVLHIPRSCKQLAQQLLVRELRAAADTLGAGPDDLAARVQHLRTYALPHLLFRVPPNHRPQDANDRDPDGRQVDPEGHSLAKIIKDRLTKAWKGEWEELRQELVADDEADARAPFRLPPT